MSGKTSKESQEFKVPPKHKYQDGEKVLCYHGPLIYEAKCLMSRYDEKEKTFQYHIHYSGWNKSWDEWVPEARVLKFNDANLQKQVDLKKAQKAEKADTKAKKKRSTSGKEKREDTDEGPSTPGGGNDSRAGTSQDEPRVTKKRRAKQETDGGEQSKQEHNVKLTENLEDKLEEDWAQVNLHKKIVKLPSPTTVDQVFDEYIKVRTEEDTGETNKLSTQKEVAMGLKEYFNAMLNLHLLYEDEMEQLDNIMKIHGEDVHFSTIYGPIHLLRMFTKLGWALSFTHFGERGAELILTRVKDFIQFLDSRPNYFNPSQYVNVDDDD